MANHVLCLLKKGERRREAWVPEHLAVVGKVLTFKRRNENHDDGWVVKIVGQKKIHYGEELDLPRNPEMFQQIVSRLQKIFRWN